MEKCNDNSVFCEIKALTYKDKISIASDSGTELPILEYLSKDDDYSVLVALSKNESSSGKILDTIWKLENLKKVSGNKIEKSVIDIVLKSLIVKNISTHKNIELSTIMDIYNEYKNSIDDNYDDSIQVLEMLARSPILPEKIIEEFVTSENLTLRKGVAFNRALPKRFYEILSKDPSQEVRWVLTKNPSTPAMIIFALTQGSDEDVRASAVMHPNYNIEIYIEEFVK